MYPIAHTAYFGSDTGRGWTETIFKYSATPYPDLSGMMLSYANLIINLRRPLLGSDRYVKGLKVSVPTPNGSVQSIPLRYAPYAYPAPPKNDGCSPTTRALCRMNDPTGTAFAPHSLGGFWDSVERNEQLNFSTAEGAAWKVLLDSYIANLVAGGWGWMALDDVNTIRGEVLTYSANADNTVTFTLEIPPAFALPAVGSTVRIRFARLNHSNSPLNTTFVCTVASTNTVKTIEQVAAGPFVTKGTYVIAAHTFAPYAGYMYAILQRKAEGRPTLQSPARRKAAARF